jgi:heat shock protein HslJ
MRDTTVRIAILAAMATMLLVSGCITINVPGGGNEPTQTPQPTQTTEPTQTTQPTMPTPTTIPTIPTQPTLPIQPTLIPTLPILQPALSGTEWVLEAMGAPGHLQPALAIKDVTLNFTDDTKLSGNAGCNSYSGKYEATAVGELSVSDIGSTMMYCTQPGLMDQERDFLDALDEAESYRVVNGDLQITSEDTILILVPA